VVTISNLPDSEFHALVPDTEVMLGSPPCVAFSNSNRSGNGSKAEGIRLIEAFLRIVARKKWRRGSKLKHWILENVPNAEKYIQPLYSASDLGLPGAGILRVKSDSSGVYRATQFGVPSKRRRYFCGEFTSPVPHHTDEGFTRPTLGEVLSSLGMPCDKNRHRIVDPNYGFSLGIKEVSDHQYVHRYAKHQWQRARMLKRDHGFMGRMAFPEAMDRPARTIMATVGFHAREAFVLEDGHGGYRAPTVREAASLMSFPIDYRFYGETMRAKHRLVGNAVPPKLACAFALSLLTNPSDLDRQGRQVRGALEGFIDLNGSRVPVAKEHPRHIRSTFRRHIPQLKVGGFRVELMNIHSDFASRDFRWEVEVHKGIGKGFVAMRPTIEKSWFNRPVWQIVARSVGQILSNPMSFNALQLAYCRTKSDRLDSGVIGPYELLDSVKAVLDDVSSSNRLEASSVVEAGQYRLPALIALGYVLLDQVLSEMGDTREEG